MNLNVSSHVSKLLEAYDNERIQLYHPARVATCIKQLNRLSIMLKQEVTLLQKIRYKQKNQHKSATWWRHVHGSQRVALRLLEQMNDSLISNLPKADQQQPTLAGPSLFRLSESSLRIMMLLDKTSSFHTKSTAAVQQLLRAALFMPLAMTLKALIARLHSIWVCLKDELQVFLSLLKSSPKKKSQMALDLDAYIGHLPQELSKYWMRITSKSGKGTKDPSASASVASSAVHSRTQSPMSSRLQEPAPSSNVSQARQQIATSSDAVMEGGAAPTPPNDSDVPPAMPDSVTASAPIATKKAKKRRKPVAADDIDAIFAGL